MADKPCFGRSLSGLELTGQSWSCAASLILLLLLLLLQAKSELIIMAEGEDGWWCCWWRWGGGGEEGEERRGGGVSQIMNGNCGVCQSAADGEHILKGNNGMTFNAAALTGCETFTGFAVWCVCVCVMVQMQKKRYLSLEWLHNLLKMN